MSKFCLKKIFKKKMKKNFFFFFYSGKLKVRYRSLRPPKNISKNGPLSPPQKSTKIFLSSELAFLALFGGSKIQFLGPSEKKFFIFGIFLKIFFRVIVGLWTLYGSPNAYINILSRSDKKNFLVKIYIFFIFFSKNWPKRAFFDQKYEKKKNFFWKKWNS